MMIATKSHTSLPKTADLSTRTLVHSNSVHTTTSQVSRQFINLISGPQVLKLHHIFNFLNILFCFITTSCSFSSTSTIMASNSSAPTWSLIRLRYPASAPLFGCLWTSLSLGQYFLSSYSFPSTTSMARAYSTCASIWCNVSIISSYGICDWSSSRGSLILTHEPRWWGDCWRGRSSRVVASLCSHIVHHLSSDRWELSDRVTLDSFLNSADDKKIIRNAPNGCKLKVLTINKYWEVEVGTAILQRS